MDQPTAYDQLNEAKYWPDRKLSYANRQIYMCRYCPTAYIRPSELLKHLRKNHNEKETNARRYQEL